MITTTTTTMSECVIHETKGEDKRVKEVDKTVNTDTNNYHIDERSFVWIKNDSICYSTAMAWGILPKRNNFDRRECILVCICGVGGGGCVCIFRIIILNLIHKALLHPLRELLPPQSRTQFCLFCRG